MFRKLTLTLCALMMMCTSVAAETLVVATNCTYPPMEFLNDKKVPNGYSIAYATEVLKRAGYEMELRDGTPASYREQIFPALLKGYLSVRPLSEAERNTVWEVYSLYHGLWFTRIVYNDDSLDSMVKKGDYEAANYLLKQMLTDMQEADDGRFRGK